MSSAVLSSEIPARWKGDAETRWAPRKVAFPLTRFPVKLLDGVGLRGLRRFGWVKPSEVASLFFSFSSASAEPLLTFASDREVTAFTLGGWATTISAKDTSLERCSKHSMSTAPSDHDWGSCGCTGGSCGYDNWLSRASLFGDSCLGASEVEKVDFSNEDCVGRFFDCSSRRSCSPSIIVISPSTRLWWRASCWTRSSWCFSLTSSKVFSKLSMRWRSPATTLNKQLPSPWGPKCSLTFTRQILQRFRARDSPVCVDKLGAPKSQTTSSDAILIFTFHFC